MQTVEAGGDAERLSRCCPICDLSKKQHAALHILGTRKGFSQINGILFA